MDIQAVLQALANKRPIFHNEADFQHALAWELRELYQYEIRLERRIELNNGQRTYIDVLAEKNGQKVAIELKYKMKAFQCNVGDEEFSLLNQGAHDIGRYDILKDLQRLEAIVGNELAAEGYLVLLTNDVSYYAEPLVTRATVDQEFRIHQGRRIHGLLSWGERAGAGTMKGREAAIAIKGQYEMEWLDYSILDHSAQGTIRALIVHVHSAAVQESSIPEAVQICLVRETEDPSNVIEVGNSHVSDLLNYICAIQDIPLSQIDLQHKLSQVLSNSGYRVETNRTFGPFKIDVWADKGMEQLAVEVRCKTALLQSEYNGKSIHLKNQAAHDISRYDFWKDVEKLEKALKSRPGVKGYAVLITNDHSYWEKPSRSGTVDEDFRIHQGREIHGRLSWRGASGGTTHLREEVITIKGRYRLNWQPFLRLGSGKNETFKVLMVQVDAS
ncbi:hypothetical protein KP806_18360 [Paenibacillus sp. N4]|uniref:hypothetical protein n=1 Tax=Paenibacillus vietnamensis TaxID=2590547 RepID=UPI001CD19431|nr:hypothetical protein [Paenibacillus vietnamensis]MCA0757028.1 hypothetical protein [Paenibacillus vietnamensis]